MSPVFRHGSLRLYLLKLLDEEPRHGYEIIRLLQDRFLGVYAPSPGTIYPRLARLEEEGLVTHDEIEGRKVYRITERGREELHARTHDLAELEEEITASVRDIAREVSEDVRETVRSLREEIASAARDMHRTRADADAQQSRDAGVSSRQKARRAKSGKGGEGKTDDAGGQADDAGGRADDAGEQTDDAWARAADEAGRPRGGRGARGWGDWPGWIGGPDWGGGPGWGGWPGGGGPHGRPSYRNFRDLERLARQFARELRTAAWHAQAVSEDALGDLRVILDETLDRIKTEVFTGTGGPRRPTDSASGPEDGPAAGTGAAEGSGPAPDERPGPGREGPSSGPGRSGPGTGPRPDAEPPADS
jgi:DNA-binding PadR family transcriptional regulator